MTNMREAVAELSYIEFQQRRGLMADSIMAALEEYHGFMMDDDYNAQGCLDRIVAHLERARPVAEQTEPVSNPYKLVEAIMDVGPIGCCNIDEEDAKEILSLMQPEIDRRVAEERAKLLERLRGLSLWLGAGSGSDDAAELEKRIRWGVDHQVSSTVQRCADVVERLSKKPGTRWGEVKAAILELQEAQFEKENSDGKSS